MRRRFWPEGHRNGHNLLDVKRDKWSIWLGTVCLGAVGLALAVPVVGWAGWLSIVFVVIALGSFIGVLATGPIEPGKWQLRTRVTAALRPRRARKQQTRALPAPTVTDRWRFTTDVIRHPQLARIIQDGFSHSAYSQQIELTPHYMRVKALVACSQLGETASWQDLRGRFLGLVTHEWIMTLISELTVIRDDATWRSRATSRRSWLEADLTGADDVDAPVASAKLLLPEAGPGLIGTDRRCAELSLHVDLVQTQELLIATGEGKESKPVIQGMPYWRRQITRALTMPGDLVGFLRHDLGLTTTDDPPAQFGILLKAREAITDIVSPGNIRALTAVPPYIVNEYTGFAIADKAGNTIEETASQIMLDLSERVLHLDGSEEEMSGLVDFGQPSGGLTSAAAADPRPA